MSNQSSFQEPRNRNPPVVFRAWQGEKIYLFFAFLGILAGGKKRAENWKRKGGVRSPPLLLDSKQEKKGRRRGKKKPKQKQGWFHLDSGQAEADEGSVQRVELPHPGRVAAGSGRRPGRADVRGGGPSCGSSAWDRWLVRPFTRLHRRRAEPGSSPHCPSETP